MSGLEWESEWWGGAAGAAGAGAAGEGRCVTSDVVCVACGMCASEKRGHVGPKRGERFGGGMGGGGWNGYGGGEGRVSVTVRVGEALL